MPWYVLYTKPKAEKEVTKSLEALGINVFCPLITEIRQWSDRKKKVSVPLFKSYVFVNLEESERDRVFLVNGIVRYLFWLGKPAVVKDEEIKVIKDWLGREDLEEMRISKYAPGDKIILEEGAFKNQEAMVKEVGKNRMRLVLSNLGFIINIKMKI
ncbi:MAG TPA: UpxY family transcription antiterminator [Salinimicrobium sp.]|nr:UpxY family transcription antiterminator [Salinimicrobium sp.]